MEVVYRNHMGGDLSVVNAARVSFNKKSDWVYDELVGPVLSDKDRRLIKFLARHHHNTPFMHNSITLYMKVPIFVARQIHKHQVGFTVNEVSRRYVSSTPDFFYPDVWRKSADNVKQGSSNLAAFNEDESGYWAYLNMAKKYYRQLLDEGLCPEQARMVLPQSMYTEFWMTGSLYGWAQMFLQRSSPDAQKEVQVVAEKIENIVRELFPVSWEALTYGKNG